MTATRTQARDEVVALFETAWQAGPPSAGLPVKYDDRATTSPTGQDSDDAPDAWARFTMRHADGNQSTLSNESGRHRTTQVGVVTVQLFTPAGDGLKASDALAQIALDAFRGKKTTPGGVWFRRCRAIEIGPSGAWFQTNVLVDFEYDELVG